MTSAPSYRLPLSLPDEIEVIRQAIEQYQSGTLSREQFRPLRVPQGIYEQREEGSFMLRVRLPAGMVRPGQMRVIADLSEEHGSGVLHVTTRQDIQIHGVSIDRIYPALCSMYEVGLSSKAGGGNTVRNITACPHAGTCWHEALDVTPFVVAMTEKLIADPTSNDLPRKCKIAFSACPRDCGGATVSDIGFIAHRNGEASFSVYVGGGLGSESRIGQKIEEAIAPEDCYAVAEAIKRVFRKYGDRENRKRARLRFLVERLGIEEFKRLYEIERGPLSGVRLKPDPPLKLALNDPAAPPVEEELRRSYERWRECNTVPQSLEGFRIVHIPLFLGDISAARLRGLADVVAQFGESQARASARQNLLLRWVAEAELPDLFDALDALELTDVRSPVTRDIVSCTGPSTCQLGLCGSRDLSRAVSEALDASGLDLWGTTVRIHISGCQNACSRHPVAPIGLYGVARRVEGLLVPHYVIQFGGRVGEGRTRLAVGTTAVPARAVPDFLVDLMRAFRSSTAYPVFDEYLQDYAGEVERIFQTHRAVPSFDQDPSFYRDWGRSELFTLGGGGPGECSGA